MAVSRKMMIAAGVAGMVALGGGYALAQGARMHDGRMGGGDMGAGMGSGMGPGMMMGARLCGANESIVPRMTSRLETSVKPTDAQKADFEALKSALAKAETTVKAACPTEAERADRSPPARLAMAEKMMAAGLDAVRTVKEPFNAFYAKLSDRQRDSMRWMARGDGQGHGHRHRG